MPSYLFNPGKNNALILMLTFVSGFGSECQWGPWSNWGQCSLSCGVGGQRRRYRLLTHTTTSGGVECDGENKEVSPCPYYPCPEYTSGEETTTFSSVKRLLGEFKSTLHGVGGRVYLTPKQNKLLIEDFSYDGRGPDAFFWVGTDGVPGSRKSVVLPHPFEGKFYDYRDPQVPRLKASDMEDIVLSLPPHLSAYNIRWISVWCRQFSVDFGHVILTDTDNGRCFFISKLYNFSTFYWLRWRKTLNFPHYFTTWQYYHHQTPAFHQYVFTQSCQMSYQAKT